MVQRNMQSWPQASKRVSPLGRRAGSVRKTQPRRCHEHHLAFALFNSHPGVFMRLTTLALGAALAATLVGTAQAQTEIQWWHSMTAVNNEWVNDLARQFN